MALSPAFDPVQRAGRERQQIRRGELIPRPMMFRRLRLPGPHRAVVNTHQKSDTRRTHTQQGINALQPLAGVGKSSIAAHLLILFMPRQLLGQRASDPGLTPALLPPTFGIALPFRLHTRRGQRGAAIAVRGTQPRLPIRAHRRLQVR